jgi:hypothetical protein
MRPNEFDDAKLLWKMFYAKECFKHAKAAAEHIFKLGMAFDSPIYYSLVTSVFVLYGKPFKNARGGLGRLGEEMIPSQHLDLHRKLLTHRDRVYAHTDPAAFKIDGFGEPNQVLLYRYPGRMELVATLFHAEYDFMPPVIDLCRTLQEKTEYYVGKLLKRCQGRVRRHGVYALNIYDPPGDFFTELNAPE